MTEKQSRAAEVIAAVQQVADDLATDSFHETACRPESSDIKASAADTINAALGGIRLLLAAVWDEGHRFTGYEPERGENPYRTDKP